VGATLEKESFTKKSGSKFFIWISIEYLIDEASETGKGSVVRNWLC
jgi:hypothetical protein